MTDNSRLIGPFSISTGNGASGRDGVVRATNIYFLHTHTHNRHFKDYVH